MNRQPLAKTKWTNEHYMAGLFGVLLLYQLPHWVVAPRGIVPFAVVVATALLLDTLSNYQRYKRVVCSVSAAVSAGIIYTLTPGVPPFAHIMGVAVALIMGKHVWGGTGKNPLNPAMLGVVAIGLLFPLELAYFHTNLLLIPALLLSLPFTTFRPYASLGLLAGLTCSAFLKTGFTPIALVSSGAIFYSCLVITDPTTSTPHRFGGLLGAFVAGLLPLVWTSPNAMPSAILAFNIFSLIMGRLTHNAPQQKSLRISALFPHHYETLLNLTPTIQAVAPQIETLGAHEILARIEKSGVYGMGGGAFPTIHKIRTALEAQTEHRYLIINGVECDPGLIHDKWLLKHNLDKVIAAAELLNRCIPFCRTLLAVKTEISHPVPGFVRITKVPDYYPAGAERLLTQQLIGVSVPASTVPAAMGILVLNVQTMCAIHDAVVFDQPTDARLITVADLVKKEACVVKVRLGTPIGEVIAGVFPTRRGLIFSGGGAMQAQMTDKTQVVDKSTNFLAIAELPKFKESPQCSKCGRCASVCPVGLAPQKIAEAIESNNTKAIAHLHGENCLSCGSCSFVCLAGRNLAAKVSQAKSTLHGVG